jgi:hypothetical protein
MLIRPRRFPLFLAVAAGALLTLGMALPARGQGRATAPAGDTAGMVGEVKPGQGRVELKPAGGADWRAVRPLAALRAGDTLRATEDAAVVVVLSGGRGTISVNAARSPYTVPAPDAGPARSDKVKSLLQSSMGFLSGASGETPRAALVTRSVTVPPLVLAPRNTPVLPDPLAFEWVGHRAGRYAVQVVGPGGVVLDRPEVVGNRLVYPAEAPPLAPGTRYTLRVLAGRQLPQESWFEVVAPARAEEVRADVGTLEQSFERTDSPTTRVILRTGLLASNGLLHDARKQVVEALAATPDDPALYTLLGALYERAGLGQQAASAYQEAQLLMDAGRPSAPPPR